MIKVEKFVFSPFSENTYVIWDDETKETIIVDPGCFDDSEENIISKFISKNDLKIAYLINTHCHIDHIFGCAFIKENYNPVFLAPEKDLPCCKMQLNKQKCLELKLKIHQNLIDIFLRC
jgi:glyoxylase-like metal-dependent hydrolase (beta-lactamase superfamily II)